MLFCHFDFNAMGKGTTVQFNLISVSFNLISSKTSTLGGFKMELHITSIKQ